MDALGSGRSDLVVDREGLLQVLFGLAWVALDEVRLTDSFQGACFLKRQSGFMGYI